MQHHVDRVSGGGGGKARIAGYLVAIVLLGLVAYFAGPPVVQWVGDRLSGPEPVPVSAVCQEAFVAANESDSAEARVRTLVECDERDWKIQQSETPMAEAELADLCAFRGGIEAKACEAVDAQRLIEANLEAQQTTTSAAPEAGAPELPGRSGGETVNGNGSVRGQTPRQRTSPQGQSPQYTTPAPVSPNGPPSFTPSQPIPPRSGSGGSGGSQGSPGPSFSGSGSAQPKPPGPSF